MVLKKYSTERIRNIAIIAHGGTGKTSLTEAMLYTSGAISKMGSVDSGSAVTDYDPEEIKRKISINAALAPCEWKNHKINIIDTPGYADFIGEVISALRVADGAIIVVCAVSGVEVQTERVWHLADEYDLPRLVFINRMDKENADFYQAMDVVKETFGVNVAPVQLPLGKESGFKGVIDLIKMTAVFSDGKSKEEEIPADLKAEAEKYREKLIESVVEADDKLLERYLEGEELTEEEIRTILKTATLNRTVVPVLCGSALKNIGILSLLDTIVEIMPSPMEGREIKGVNPKTQKEEIRKHSEKEPLTALVFKSVADPYVGKLTFLRVYSGVLHADSAVHNASRGKRERIGHLFFMQGKNQIETSDVPAGDIAAVPKLNETFTGDTLCDEGKPIKLQPPTLPEPMISVAIEPKTKGDEEKLSTSLMRLAEEDLTLRVRRDHETRQTIVSGVGDMHLEVTIDHLRRKFGVEATLSTPKIPYKETVLASARAQGKYKRQTGGRGQYGDAWIEVEPLPRGAGYEFVDKIVGGAIPKQYIPAVEKGLKEALEGGVLAGYPVIDVKVTVYDGSFHPVDSSDMAFKIAGSMALKKAVLGANPILLEPIMKVEVIVSEEYMGDVIGDLSGKRGKILGMEPRGRNQVIKALVPLAEIAKYATQLRSITHGRGTYGMEFSHYEQVPGDIAQKIIEEAKREE
ncbi:MAG: elongation factor G [Actinomycetota bacterium]|nr:elongation factor G [Actinomycetota bacterium]MDI6822234.1 elongation factor G [Actinomycetota bacterium]